jgi:CheY-like chemotaxis protein
MVSVRMIGGIPGQSPNQAAIPYPALFGLQILVVEDEALVSMMLEDMLAEFGCVVAGVAATVSQALTEISGASGMDAAILDVHLGGEKIFPVADVLTERGVPVIFSTGYGPADLAQRYPQSRLLHKPYAPEELAQVLTDITRGPLH